MKKIVLVLLLLVLIVLFIYGDRFTSSEPKLEVIPDLIQVESLLTRYGKQESVVLKVKNIGENDILFPDNQYGINLFKRQIDGLWSQIASPRPLQSQIVVIRSGQAVEIEFEPFSLAEGEYRVVFEGWERQDISTVVKGETAFAVITSPTFKISLANRVLKSTDALDIIVTNDRASNIIFNDNTLNLRLFIKNETDDWMELPSPLYSDDVPFELEPGQKYIINMPPLKANGDYKIVVTGKDAFGLDLVAQIEVNIFK